MVLFLSIGIVSASDNQTVDSVGAAHDADLAVDSVSADVNDTVKVSADDFVNRDVLAAQEVDDISEDAIVSEGKQVSKEEVLGASGDNDILRETATDTGVTANFRSLNTFITNNAGKDIILTQDYPVVAGAANNNPSEGVTLNVPSITGNLNNAGGYVTISRAAETSGAHQHKIFHVPNNHDVTISNIKFVGARDNYVDYAGGDYGGAIRVGDNAHVTFINCIFEIYCTM